MIDATMSPAGFSERINGLNEGMGDLAPMQSWGDSRQNCLHDMRIVGNTQLVWDGQQERVGFRDRLVFSKLFDQDIRLGCIATAEDRSCGFVKEAYFVLFLTAASEIATITVVDQCENTAANGDARSASMASLLPGGAEGANLRRLLDVERLAALVEFKG